MAAKASNDDLYRVLSTAVDTAFYRGVYGDLAGSALDPVAHYGQVGWRDGLDPAAWFSTSGYLRLNPDVAEGGANPLYHYLLEGRAEGREIVRSELGEAYLFGQAASNPAWGFETGTPPAPAAYVAPSLEAHGPLTPAQRDLVAEHFDAAFYLGANGDVAAAGHDPLEHFISTGWRERRDPSASFSITDYLELNPEVAGARMNPFVHYLVAGKAEGRAAKRNLGFRHDVIAALKPMDVRIAESERQTALLKPDAAATLATALAASRSGLADLHVTFSHDNYSANVGGVQLCLQREAARIAGLGRDHLHIFPVVAYPLARDTSPTVLGVLWNGDLVGQFRPSEIVSAVQGAVGPVTAGQRSFAVHSLLGHCVDDVLALLAAAGLKQGYFWIHDFASLCDGYHLMRNDVADCGAPPLESPACSICVYGPLRRRQIAAHEALFDALEVTAVAPSAAALETWRQGWSFRTAGERVLHHAELAPRVSPTPVAESGAFRFAFLGITAPYKGWSAFRDLAIRFASDRRYTFLHLAKNTVQGLPIEHYPVSVTAERPFAMREEIEALGVDAAMLWSLCRETFSFAAYEAVAAGAAVVTCPDSGNIARFTADGGHGLVLDDEAALIRMFETGQILELARSARRPTLHDLAFSGLTVDLLTEAGR